MIDTSKVQFPLTLAAFASLQRNEMRRIPTIEEMEIFSHNYNKDLVRRDFNN